MTWYAMRHTLVLNYSHPYVGRMWTRTEDEDGEARHFCGVVIVAVVGMVVVVVVVVVVDDDDDDDVVVVVVVVVTILLTFEYQPRCKSARVRAQAGTQAHRHTGTH